MSRYPGALLVVVAVCASACGSASGAGHTKAVRAARPAQSGPSQVIRARHSVTVHLGRGPQSASLRVHEPSGVILLYRIGVPAGAEVRGVAQLPSITVPLVISTDDRAGRCANHGTRVVCTVGEEWCPMPEGAWHVHLRKLAGPAGDVTLWFHVGTPPSTSASLA